MVGSGLDQRVVLGEHAARHRVRLHADEAADLLAQRPHEGLALPQAVDRLEPVDLLEVVARVQVREDRARLVARRAGDLDDVFDFLARLLVDADVLARSCRTCRPGCGPSRGTRWRRRRRDSCPAARRSGSSGRRSTWSAPYQAGSSGSATRYTSSVRVVVDDVTRAALHELEAATPAANSSTTGTLTQIGFRGHGITSSRPDPRPARVRAIRRPSSPTEQLGSDPHSAAEQLDLELDGRKHDRKGRPPARRGHMMQIIQKSE